MTRRRPIVPITIAAGSSRSAAERLGRAVHLFALLVVGLVLAMVLARPTISAGSPHPQPQPEGRPQPLPGFDEVCNEDAESCFEVHDSPGCVDPACCEIVCTNDPMCCTDTWDVFCVQAAEAFCEVPPFCPTEGPCFEPHEGVGCEDPACCELMCEVDGFCCGVIWDAQCAELAMAFCGTAPCELPPPGNELLEEELCEDRTNDGCNLPVEEFAPIACGDAIRGTAFAGTPRDTDWYLVTLEEETEVTWTVTSEFPSHLLIMSGTCAHALTVVNEAFGGECGPASITACLEPGTHFLFIAAGAPEGFVRGAAPCPFDPDKNPDEDPPFKFWGFQYLAEFACNECGPAEPTPDLNGDGVVNVFDLLILLGQWGVCGDPDNCPADLNGDGVVNVFDLLILLGAWGTAGTPG